VDVTVAAEGTNIYIDYDPLAAGTDYVPPRVKIEFGARSTGEPFEERQITCDAAEYLPDLEFPSAKPRVMLPKRTFWEKAAAVHVFCADSGPSRTVIPTHRGQRSGDRGQFPMSV
jgi:hypothetical protein